MKAFCCRKSSRIIRAVCRVSGPVREYVPVTVLARRGGAALIASPMLRGGMSVLLFPAADSAPS